MKRTALLLLFTVLLACPSPARAATVSLFGFTGYDYEDPNTDTGNYLAVGEGYKVVGFVTSVDAAYLGSSFNPGVNECTVHLYDLTVASHAVYGSFLVVTFNNGGRVRYYCDPIAGGTAATYGVNPPNATAPSTFTDGSMRLGGAINNFALSYNTSTNSGQFQGDLSFDEGPDLGNIPIGQWTGWVLGGLAGAQPGGGGPTLPDGYNHQVSGEAQILATPTTHTSWGAVKALYH